MISIIIPVIDEAAHLPGLLNSIAGEAAPHEVIVVDGGSQDGTPDIARALGATVLTSKAGRGNQICCGVERARGDIFFFLHADSVFPPGGLTRVEETLNSQHDVIGGNFRLVFDGETSFSRGLTVFYALMRLAGRYYGDSGIFVRRRAYDAIGGMRPIPVMEDLDFVCRLERYGRTCCITELPLVTSSRRFQGRSAPAIIFGWL
jgi:rSAM/selenodomain-associated transferase 2